jgi:glycosyltransferase involved in cell wall biosynthesis
MRIVHITINPIDFERRIFNQAITGRKCKHKIWVIALGKPGEIHHERKKTFNLWRIPLRYFERGGPLKFLSFNIKVFFCLLFKSVDLIHCHDLWVLPSSAILSLFKNTNLLYDAHEYYTGLEIFLKRPLRKFLWSLAERLSMPMVDALVTVSVQHAKLYKLRYPKFNNIQVIRNLPQFEAPKYPSADDGLKEKKDKMIVFHGHFKPGRGLENLIEALAQINDVQLLLIGEGELKPKLEKLIDAKKINAKIHLRNYIQTDLLISFISQADIGVVLFEPTNINYASALPNKFFEYIMAGLPVLASNIDTLKEIIDTYNIGLTVNPLSVASIVEGINSIFNNQARLLELKKNTRKAARELCWENEEEKLIEIYKSFDV